MSLQRIVRMRDADSSVSGIFRRELPTSLTATSVTCYIVPPRNRFAKGFVVVISNETFRAQALRLLVAQLRQLFVIPGWFCAHNRSSRQCPPSPKYLSSDQLPLGALLDAVLERLSGEVTFREVTALSSGTS